MPLQQFDERVPVIVQTRFADTYVAPAQQSLGGHLPAADWRVDNLFVVNNDTVDHHLLIQVSTLFAPDVVDILIPAGIGVGATPPLDILAQLFPAAFHYWVIPFWDTPLWALTATPSAGKIVQVYAFGAAY